MIENNIFSLKFLTFYILSHYRMIFKINSTEIFLQLFKFLSFLIILKVYKIKFLINRFHLRYIILKDIYEELKPFEFSYL